MKVNELKALCKQYGYTGYSKMNKSAMIELLQHGSDSESDTESKNDGIAQIPITDTFTENILRKLFTKQIRYVQGLQEDAKEHKLKIRMPVFPEYLSENITKFIIRNKLGDQTCTWDCKKGDLLSQIEGKQEVKCFTSDGPPSFTPSSKWDVIYFLDGRKWLNNKFILYKVSLTNDSTEWRNINMSKADTFGKQADQGRRPRIKWNSLHPQIESYCTKIYDGTFEGIFTPLGAKE
jgi:hypothetical protein